MRLYATSLSSLYLLLLLGRKSQMLNFRELELGVGNKKLHPNAVGIDLRPSPAVDLVGDAIGIMGSLSEAVTDAIYSAHFLEHVQDLDGLLSAGARVLRDGGLFEAIVPHWSNPFYYSDPTHRRPFGLYSFAYLADCDLFVRQVPKYDSALHFGLVDVKLIFRSEDPVRRRVINRAYWTFGRFVNRSRSSQEFYEEVLSTSIPCYEIVYSLRRKSRTVLDLPSENGGLDT